jgi:hypothetical protein
MTAMQRLKEDRATTGGKTLDKPDTASNEGRHRDLLRAVEDRAPLVSGEVSVNVFDFDRRVVHKNANRERQTAERHDVQRLSERAENMTNRESRGESTWQRRAKAPAKREPRGLMPR